VGGGIKAFFGKRVFSLGLLLAIAFFLLVSLAVSAMLSAAGARLGGLLPEGLSTAVLFVINLVISLAVIGLLFAAMFKVLPDAKIAWRDVWVGAVVTAVLFMIGKFLIGLYLGKSNPGEPYGAAGSLAILFLLAFPAKDLKLGSSGPSIFPPDSEVPKRSVASRTALAEYFRELIAKRRASPRADLLSGLIAAEEAGDKLSENELLATCILLLIAGHETTVNLIGNGTLALLRHPDQLRRLRENPALIGTAVEELLRFDGPVQRTARIPSEDVVIDGCTIAKGEMVMPFIGAADRDPAQFPEPDRLDIGRADNRHIAFGWGIHFCLGAPLARVEGQIAINTLVQRLPKLALATDTPQFRESLTLRGLASLPVQF